MCGVHSSLMKPAHLVRERDGTVSYPCGGCHTRKSVEHFYPSSIKRPYHRCKTCLKEAKRAYRSRVSGYQKEAARLERRTRRLFPECAREFLEADDIKHVVETLFNGRSALSAHTAPLSVTALDPRQPPGLENIVCLTQKERQKHDQGSVVPPAFVQHIHEVLQGKEEVCTKFLNGPRSLEEAHAYCTAFCQRFGGIPRDWEQRGVRALVG